MRISDWSSDVCSSDLDAEHVPVLVERRTGVVETADVVAAQAGVHALAIPVHAGNAAPLRQAVHLEIRDRRRIGVTLLLEGVHARVGRLEAEVAEARVGQLVGHAEVRSEEHTSELQSLMRTSYAVFCLKKKKKIM